MMHHLTSLVHCNSSPCVLLQLLFGSLACLEQLISTTSVRGSANVAIPRKIPRKISRHCCKRLRPALSCDHPIDWPRAGAATSRADGTRGSASSSSTCSSRISDSAAMDTNAAAIPTAARTTAAISTTAATGGICSCHDSGSFRLTLTLTLTKVAVVLAPLWWKCSTSDQEVYIYGYIDSVFSFLPSPPSPPQNWSDIVQLASKDTRS